ncbi:MAG: sugar transferase [Pseudomonadota bacterium]
MDVSLAILLGSILFLPGLLIAFCVLLLDGRPVFYRSERMKTCSRGFTLWKFRTMREGSADNSVTGGYKSDRVTRFGRLLRRTRLDEIPQLFNILRGDMSFVGPRPPLRRFVNLRPDIYKEVLRARPGITGFATLFFHETEERLLGQCHTAQEADAVYIHQCIPAKARLDLYWTDNSTVWRDLVLLWMTFAHVGCGGSGTPMLTKSTRVIRT